MRKYYGLAWLRAASQLEAGGSDFSVFSGAGTTGRHESEKFEKENRIYFVLGFSRVLGFSVACTRKCTMCTPFRGLDPRAPTVHERTSPVPVGVEMNRFR